MDSSLADILKNNKTYNPNYYSHVSLIHPKGKFQFDRKSLEKFWDTFSSSTEIKGIAEKPEHVLPILVDVDLKIQVDSKQTKRLYTEKDAKTVIKIYQKILKEITDNDSINLTCLLLEKDPYIDDKNNKLYLKNGYHLHFPYIFLSKVDQEVHLIPRIKKQLLKKDMNPDMIDKSYCRVPWLMYGSRKTEKQNNYKITRIFNKNMEEISMKKAFKNYKIFDYDEEQIEFSNKIEYYLPRILSIHLYGREEYEYNVKPNLPSLIKNNILPNYEDNNIKPFRKLTIKENIEKAKELLPLISKDRSNDYNEWINIGFILYCITDGCKEGLDLWLNFSKLCEDKYNEAKCVYEWKKMTKKGYTVGSLIYYAKEDNPDEYKKLRQKKLQSFIADTLSNGTSTHNDIARALFEYCEEEFICSSLTHKSWYQFRNHRWKEIEEGVYLRIKISGELCKYYVEEGKNAITKLDGKSKDAMEGVKKIMKIINSLKSAPFKNNVMKEAMEVFYDDKFCNKIDANPYLIGFHNGVYDLKTNIFRDGRPSDYISMKMNVEYDINIKDSDPEVSEVYDFLEKIFPDKSIRQYFLDISSDIFVGGNPSKIVQFWSGEGDNGKSITQILFEKMMGNYSIKLPTSLITGKRTQSSAACPELVRAGNGVRWVVLQEPDQKDFLNIGVLKELSGNDTFYARGLYKSGREITPMFKVVLICNEPPKIPNGDKATWNRIRVIPFESTFCDDAPKTYEEQLRQKRFPKDRHFADKIPNMVKAFAWVLINHRKNITKRVEPEKVKLATNAYRKRNDIYRQFVEESIMEKEDSILSITEIYTQFKEWFRDSLPGQSVPIKNDVKEYFLRLWGEAAKGWKWQGYRIRTLQDDLDSGEAFILGQNESET